MLGGSSGVTPGSPTATSVAIPDWLCRPSPSRSVFLERTFSLARNSVLSLFSRSMSAWRVSIVRSMSLQRTARTSGGDTW